MTGTFNPPPHWPEPSADGTAPGEGWHPDPAWGPVPAGWRLRTAEDDAAASEACGPLAESGEIRASGITRPSAAGPYPVNVTLPGQVEPSSSAATADDAFPEQTGRAPRPRLRLVLRLLALLLGLAIATATAFLFVRLVHYAQEDLPAQSLSVPGALVVAAPSAS